MFTNLTDQDKWGIAPFVFGLVFLLTSFVLLFDHFWFNGYIEFDSFTNATVGYHIAEGKALYREVWGSKPPGIYFLDALFLTVFGVSHSAIWMAQIISGTLLITLFYLIIFRVTNNMLLSWLSTALFVILFYFSIIYQGGNLTEEFGVVWIMAGWVGILTWYFNGYYGGLWVGGAAMCMALWFKEPFLFSVTPAGIWLVMYSVKYRNPGIALRFIGGALIPVIAFLLYFISSNTLDDYIAYFYYTSAYSDYTGLTLLEKVGNSLRTMDHYFSEGIRHWHLLFLISVPGLIMAKGKRKVILSVLVVTFLLELVAISLSGYTFQHYYFQLIPTFYLCVFISLSVIIDRVRYPGLEWKLAFNGVILLTGCVIGYVQIRDFQRFPAPVPRPMDLAVADKLDQMRTENSTLFVEDPLFSHLYVQTRMTSSSFIPVPVFHFFMVDDKYAEKRKERFVRSIQDTPPDYIVTGTKPGVLDNFYILLDWFPEHYTLYFTEELSTGALKLWVRNDLVPVNPGNQR